MSNHYQNLQNSYGAEAVVHSNLPEVAPSPYGAEDQGPQTRSPARQQTWHEGYQNVGAPPPAAEKEVEKKKKKILGLSVPWFWAVVGLVVLVVLGVSLGVSLGVGLGAGMRNLKASQDAAAAATATASPAADLTAAPNRDSTISSSPTISSSSSSSSTSTTSTFTPIKTGTVGLADNSCTYDGAKTVHAQDGTKFTTWCATDWPDGIDASDGSGKKVNDIGKALVYSFEDCMEFCLSFNRRVDSGGGGGGGAGSKCAGVTYNSNITSIYQHSQASCFLKDHKGRNLPGSAESACAAIAL